MRGLWKNRALRRETACYLALTALAALLAALWRPAAGLIALAAGAAFTLLNLYFAKRRFDAMARLSLRIDRVLHGQDAALITENDEGELSILESQIKKMTLRLSEQAGLLRSEKAALARAMEDIFHQIRTPLTALNLETALLAEDGLPDGRRLELTRQARRQLRRLEWLVETLLKMSRIDAGAVEFRRDTVPAREVVRRAAEPLDALMELRGLTLEVSAGAETFTGDPAWTAEALGNLLKNCMEHTPPGGTVSVRCEDNPLYLQFTVRDTGPGFDPADLPRLFERFYRGKNAGADSVGIGLALARMIAAEQGGTLTADNPPEGGARFVLRFNKSVI